jgi:hypothetical protein
MVIFPDIEKKVPVSMTARPVTQAADVDVKTASVHDMAA